MKKLKRIIEKQCPMCHNTCYMMVEAENYGTIMEYMVAMYYKTKRKVIQEALPFLKLCTPHSRYFSDELGAQN